MQRKFSEDKTYIIMGMHKSGTSFIARCLKDMGVNMGENLLEPDKVNVEGHFENIDFIKLNDEILSEAGGSWDNPPQVSSIRQVSTRFRDRIKELIKKNKDAFWGWKDPRTSLTAEAYLPFLEGDTYLICVFRKPDKVAKSLQRRANLYGEDFPYEKGIQLTNIYNERIIDTIRTFLKT